MQSSEDYAALFKTLCIIIGMAVAAIHIAYIKPCSDSFLAGSFLF